MAMLFIILPLSLVFPAIRPPKQTHAVFMIILKASFVDASVNIFYCASSSHFVINPGADIFTSIGPSVGTMSMYLVVHELTTVLCFILESKRTKPIFLSFTIGSFVSTSILPNILSYTISSIEFPHSFIDSSIRGNIFAIAACLARFPKANITLSRGLGPLTKPMGLVLIPVAFILRLVIKFENSKTLLLISIELACIYSAAPRLIFYVLIALVLDFLKLKIIKFFNDKFLSVILSDGTSSISTKNGG